MENDEDCDDGLGHHDDDDDDGGDDDACENGSDEDGIDDGEVMLKTMEVLVGSGDDDVSSSLVLHETHTPTRTHSVSVIDSSFSGSNTAKSGEVNMEGLLLRSRGKHFFALSRKSEEGNRKSRALRAAVNRRFSLSAAAHTVLFTEDTSTRAMNE